MLTKYNTNDRMKYELGVACSMYGGKKRFMQGCGGGKREGKSLRGRTRRRW